MKRTFLNSTIIGYTVLLYSMLSVSVFIYSKWSSVEINISDILLISAVVTIPSYLMLVYVFNKVVVGQVENIYRLMNQPLNIDSVAEGKIDKVGEDMAAWTDKKDSEIRSLKEMENYRKEFLGNVSHELKTPIFNIQGYIESLIDGGIDDPKYNRKFLTLASRSIERMIHLVNDLDAISRLEEQTLELKIEKFDLTEVVKETFESLEIKAESKNIKLGFKEGSRKVMNVSADRELIGRVLTNLIVNSIKYGNEDGVTLIEYRDLHDRLIVEVSDDGFGISSEHLPRLFQRFYRIEESRTRDAGGTGLGLAIVKHIMEAHDQTITVRSEVGKGTTFSFTLSKA